MKNLGKIILNWLAVLAWMGVIFYFSSQPDLKSELTPVWDTIFRKIAHMAEFFVLAFLLFRAYAGNALPQLRSLILAVFIAVIYAAADEYHQAGVAGRVGSPVDVIIDSVGILAFFILKFRQIKK